LDDSGSPALLTFDGFSLIPSDCIATNQNRFSIYDIATKYIERCHLSGKRTAIQTGTQLMALLKLGKSLM